MTEYSTTVFIGAYLPGVKTTFLKKEMIMMSQNSDKLVGEGARKLENSDRQRHTEGFLCNTGNVRFLHLDKNSFSLTFLFHIFFFGMCYLFSTKEYLKEKITN